MKHDMNGEMFRRNSFVDCASVLGYAYGKLFPLCARIGQLTVSAHLFGLGSA